MVGEADLGSEPEAFRRSYIGTVGLVMSLAGAVMAVLFLFVVFGQAVRPAWAGTLDWFGGVSAFAAVPVGVAGALLCRRARAAKGGDVARSRVLRAGSLVGWTAAATTPMVFIGFFVLMLVAGAPD